MKNTVLAVFALLFAIGCKKEKKSEPTENTAPAAADYMATVKVNGSARQSVSYSSNQSGTYINLDGNNEQLFFSYNQFTPPGTYALVKYGNPYLLYIKNNTYYRATTGSITITAIDTSAKGLLNKLSGSFEFKTDTTSGVFYAITEGQFNIR